MKTKIIHNEQEYDVYCARIYELIHSRDEALEPASVDGDELELLFTISK